MAIMTEEGVTKTINYLKTIRYTRSPFKGINFAYRNADHNLFMYLEHSDHNTL